MTTIRTVRHSFTCMALAGLSGMVLAASVTPGIDDFSEPGRNSLGIDRMFFTDTTAGGQTTIEHTVEAGGFNASGTITPPRGQLGWASVALLLDPEGAPVDAAAFEGIRLKVRVKSGNLSVTANSAKVTNYDYHAAQVQAPADGEFHEVRVAFDDMKRAWSEPTALDPATLLSISLVSWDVRAGEFEYEVDDISFY